MTDIILFPGSDDLVKAGVTARAMLEDLGPIIRRTQKALASVDNAKNLESLLLRYTNWLSYMFRKRRGTLSYLPKREDEVIPRYSALIAHFREIEDALQSDAAWINRNNFESAAGDMSHVIFLCEQELIAAALECERLVNTSGGSVTPY